MEKKFITFLVTSLWKKNFFSFCCLLWAFSSIDSFLSCDSTVETIKIFWKRRRKFPSTGGFSLLRYHLWHENKSLYSLSPISQKSDPHSIHQQKRRNFRFIHKNLYIFWGKHFDSVIFFFFNFFLSTFFVLILYVFLQGDKFNTYNNVVGQNFHFFFWIFMLC